MAEVSVEINGRKYRMACEDGQEAHLTSLASRFNGYIDEYKGAFGEIGDNRLTVMAGIAILDELSETQRRLETMRSELDEVTHAGQEVASEAESMETRFASKMDDVARRIEAVASSIDAATRRDGSEPDTAD